VTARRVTARRAMLLARRAAAMLVAAGARRERRCVQKAGAASPGSAPLIPYCILAAPTVHSWSAVCVCVRPNRTSPTSARITRSLSADGEHDPEHDVRLKLDIQAPAGTPRAPPNLSS
jgi:hypothetical protein